MSSEELPALPPWATDLHCYPPYQYKTKPNVALAAVGVGIFVVLTSLHAFRMVRFRAWKGVCFVLGGTFMFVGFATRVVSTQHLCNKAAYGVQLALLRLGPTLLMFGVTTMHTEFIKAIQAERFLWVPARMQHMVYLSINLVLFAIQAIGTSLVASATTRHEATVGSDLVVTSYVTQLVFWLFILAENTVVGIRLKAANKRAAQLELSTSTSEQSTSMAKDLFPQWARWQQLIGLGIGVIACGRNVMRMTELGVPFLTEREWPGYAFDGYQMAVVMGAWGIFYLPGRCIEVFRAQKRRQLLSLRMEQTSSV